MMYEERARLYQKSVETFLPAYLPVAGETPEKLEEAMAYSLLAGGKRIRPLLSLAVADLLADGASEQKAVETYAAAVEMVHTYSLIHDDLPSMDNDVLRRGKPTSHVVYGEAMAILAGDALLTRAFELAGEAAGLTDEPSAAADRVVKAWGHLASFAGSSGMIGGQVLDLEGEGQALALDALRTMQEKKTGALLKAAVLGAAELLAAPLAVKEILADYALGIGRAFQIRDDILDASSSAEELGKTPGKDQANQKATYVTIVGMEEAESYLQEASQKALTACGRLTNLGYNADFLSWFAGYLSGRRN